jgi:hypothetical protein
LIGLKKKTKQQHATAEARERLGVKEQAGELTRQDSVLFSVQLSRVHFRLMSSF